MHTIPNISEMVLAQANQIHAYHCIWILWMFNKFPVQMNYDFKIENNDRKYTSIGLAMKIVFM